MGGKVINEIGNVYGRLIALRRDKSKIGGEAYWICQCSCGSGEVSIRGSHLRRKMTKSCGCYRREITSERNFEDMEGKIFGRLVVEQRVENTKSDNKVQWLCSCVCGTWVVVRARCLKRGSTRSCGCLMREGNNKLPSGEAAFNFLINNYKYKAKQRGLMWGLTRNQFREITLQLCHYCNIKPKQVIGEGNNGCYVYNGIDRVDNSGGYFLENVVPCCGNCNAAKMAMGYEEFREWIGRVYNHWGKSE